ncbi:Inactive LRR receptor-like serine/threonine-protein kinase bir2 [Ranunculus cassubicifolius]
MKTFHDHLLFFAITYLVFFSSQVQSIEDDIRCLRGVKSSLKDPQNRLSSWNFINNTVNFLCKFIGVSCWNDRENRLIGLELKSMGLGGEISDSLQFCSSLQTLDLSDNKFSGPIPSRLCDWMPYLVNIDLSQNDFTGPIPTEFANCTYLNALNLDSNKLSGSIPYQLSRIKRLRKFSVANNDLSGRIPSFLAKYDSANFNGNSKLCGPPLRSKCGH